MFKPSFPSILEKQLIFNQSLYTVDDFKELKNEIEYTTDEFESAYTSDSEYEDEMFRIIHDNFEIFHESCVREYYNYTLNDLLNMQLLPNLSEMEFESIKKKSCVEDFCRNITIEMQSFKVLNSKFKYKWKKDVSHAISRLNDKFPKYMVEFLLPKLL